jgi:AraC-like DNA-binding protein
VTGSDTVVIGTMIEGTVQFDRGKDTDRYQPGDVALGSWPGQASYTSHTHRLRCRGLILPVSLLHAVAGRAPSAPLRFLSPRPASPADRTRWTNTSGYIDTLMASAEHWPETRPLIIGSATRLLAATILVVFPNTWDTDPAARDRNDASTATLRRAIAFIDEHAAQDISLAERRRRRARHHPRGQIAFRRHYDITPAGYLRRIRLERARQEPLAADPARESVTAVAYRWGLSARASSPPPTARPTASRRTRRCARISRAPRKHLPSGTLTGYTHGMILGDAAGGHAGNPGRSNGGG